MEARLDYREARWAAEALGLDAAAVLQLLEAGELPGLKLGERWLVSERGLAKYLRNEERRQFEERRARKRSTAHRRLAPAPHGRQRTRFEVEYSFLGSRYQAPSMIALLIDVLRKLADQDSSFLQRFSQQSGRERRYVASNLADLYPGRPDLARFAREVLPGWWLGTNFSAKDIESILEKAGKSAGLSFGVDLVMSGRTREVDMQKALAFVGIAADPDPDAAARHDELFADVVLNDTR